MENKIDVINFNGKQYFKLVDVDKVYLCKALSASHALRGICNSDTCVEFDVFHKKSLRVSGTIYDSDYMKCPIYAVGYSETPRVSTTILHVQLFADDLEAGNVLTIDTKEVDSSIAEGITEHIKQKDELKEMIRNSTAKFINRCKKEGVDVNSSVSPPHPYPKKVRPNTWIIN